MANQVLVPPELDKQDQPREPKLLAEIIDEPAWKTIADNIYDLLYPRKLPPLVLTSKPIAVVDPMKENRGRAASIISVATHVVIIALILWAFMAVKKAVTKKNQLVTNIDVPQYMPIAPKGPQMGGGGGGGSHDILQAPKGRLPKFEEQPIVPPMVIKNDHPKLTADPAIMMPKDIQLPNNNLPNLGDRLPTGAAAERVWVPVRAEGSARAKGTDMVRVRVAVTAAVFTTSVAVFPPPN
jgi:periplasmic protein TonB